MAFLETDRKRILPDIRWDLAGTGTG